MPLFNKYLKRETARTLSGTDYRAPRAKALLLSEDEHLIQHRESNPLPESMERQKIYDLLLSSAPEDIRKLRETQNRTAVEDETLAFMREMTAARERSNTEHIKLLNDIEIAVSRMTRLGQLDASEAPAKKRQALQAADARMAAIKAEEKKRARKKADELFELVLKNRRQSAPVAKLKEGQRVVCDTPFVEGVSKMVMPLDFSEPEQYGVEVWVQYISDRSLGLVDEEDTREREIVRGVDTAIAPEYAGAEGIKERRAERAIQKKTARERADRRALEALRLAQRRSREEGTPGVATRYTIAGDHKAEEAGIAKLVERLQTKGGEMDSLRRYNTYGQRFAWQVLYDMLAPQLRKLLLKGGTLGYGWDPDDIVQETFTTAAGLSKDGTPTIWAYDPKRVRGGILSYLKVIADRKINNAIRKESPTELTGRRYLCIGKKKEPVYQFAGSLVGRRQTGAAAKVYFDEIPHGEKDSAETVVRKAIERPLYVLEDGQWRQLSAADLDPNRPKDERVRFTVEYATEEFTPEPYQRFVRDEAGRTVQEEVQPGAVTRKIRTRAELAILDAGNDSGEREEGEYLGGSQEEAAGRTEQISDWEVILEKGFSKAAEIGLREEDIGREGEGAAMDLSEASDRERRDYMLAVLGALAASDDPDRVQAIELFIKNKMLEISVRDLREERDSDGNYLYTGPSGDQMSEGTVKNRINLIRDLLVVECAKALGEEIETVAARVEAAHVKGAKRRTANPTDGLAGLRHRLRQVQARRSNPELSPRAMEYLDSFFAD